MPPKTKKSPANNNHGYEEFVRGIELIGVALTRCSASLDRDRFRKASEEKHVHPSLKDTYRLSDFQSKCFEAVGEFVVRIVADDEQPCVVVECEFTAHFHAQSDLDQQYAKRFSESEVQLVLVPFARQFIAGISGSMCIPPLVMPLYRRFPVARPKSPVREKKDVKEKQSS